VRACNAKDFALCSSFLSTEQVYCLFWCKFREMHLREIGELDQSEPVKETPLLKDLLGWRRARRVAQPRGRPRGAVGRRGRGRAKEARPARAGGAPGTWRSRAGGRKARAGAGERGAAARAAERRGRAARARAGERGAGGAGRRGRGRAREARPRAGGRKARAGGRGAGAGGRERRGAGGAGGRRGRREAKPRGRPKGQLQDTANAPGCCDCGGKWCGEQVLHLDITSGRRSTACWEKQRLMALREPHRTHQGHCIRTLALSPGGDALAVDGASLQFSVSSQNPVSWQIPRCCGKCLDGGSE
jgi:hypothetical protein